MKKKKNLAAAAEEENSSSSSSSDGDDEEENEEENEEASDAGSHSSRSSDTSNEEDAAAAAEEEEEEEEEASEEESDDDDGGGGKKQKNKKKKNGGGGPRAGDDAASVGSFDAYQQAWTVEDDDDDELEPEEMEQRLANKYRRVQEVRGRSIVHMHPELTPISQEEMLALSRVVRNERGEVADPLHRRSAALLSKYEFTAVTSKRAEQLDRDDEPLVQDLPPGMVSSIAIAHYEFQKGALNDIFIIQRPFPDGSSEYWRLGDLEYV